VGQRGQDRLVISSRHNRYDLSMVRQGSSGCSSDIRNGKSNASTGDFSSGGQSDILSLLSLKDSGLVDLWNPGLRDLKPRFRWLAAIPSIARAITSPNCWSHWFPCTSVYLVWNANRSILVSSQLPITLIDSLQSCLVDTLHIVSFVYYISMQAWLQQRATACVL